MCRHRLASHGPVSRIALLIAALAVLAGSSAQAEAAHSQRHSTIRSTPAGIAWSTSFASGGPTQKGLVASYDFEEGSGTTTSDGSRNGNDGTLSGATWTSSGKNGGALSFDGVNDWVTIPSSPSLALTNAMTLEAWVKPSALGTTWRTVLVKEQPAQLAYALYAHDGGPGASGHVYVAGSDQFSPSDPIPAGAWTHLAATYNGTNLRLYVNGNLATTLNTSGSITTSTRPLRIGGNAVWGEWFSGLIDQVRIYKRALTASDIQRDMGTVSSAPADVTPPTTPTGLVASAATQNSITLSWNASADDTGVAGYGVYRGGTSIGNTSSTSYTATALACGSTFTFAVDAYDNAGNRSGPASVTAATGACPDTTAPSTPSSLTVSGSTQSSLSLTWGASSDNVGVAGYGRYNGGTLVSSGTGTGYTFTGLACGTTYTLAVDAYDAAGNRSAKAQMSGSTLACSTAPDTVAPTQPTNLTPGSSAQTSVTLSWSASTDNVGVSGYGRYLNGVLVSSGTGTSFTFANLVCGTSYLVAVDAYDAAGNRSAKTSLTSSTSACPDVSPPSTPANLVASAQSQDSLTLSWNASLDNIGVAGYTLYNGVTTVASTALTSYTLSGLACGTSYALALDAYDAAGNRSAKALLTAATSACPAPSAPSSANVFLSPSGSDSNPCTQASPCASFNRGYHLAQPGQVVEVAAGTYPDQPIDSDASKTSASDVVLRPAAGATVRAGQVNIDAAKHLEIQGMQLAGWHTFNGTDDITFRNITADDLYIDSSSNINILGGSYGPDTDYDNGQIRPACSGCPHSRNITIDGVYFHDAIITPGSGAHVECLQVWGTDYLTIRNSKFWNCEHHSVFIAGEGEPLSNITLENNWGGKVRSGYYSFRVTGSGPGEGCTNITYRDNSATTAIALTCLTASNVQVIGNVSPLSAGQCDSRYVWSYNVWDGAKCGASDLNAPSGFVNPSAFDLHLAPGSAAVNHGDPTSYPARDIDGQARPMGGMPDAGADESQ